MNRSDLLKEIADHHYALADLYQQLAGESATAPVSAAGPGSSGSVSPAAGEHTPVPSAPAIPSEGSLDVCPKHRIPYTEGSYGPYCKQQTDEPAWGKQKGDTLWCRITPKNAAEYLRIKAAAA